ncbi:MAG: hypothetical protein HKP49_09665 [Maribacter sp.]|nr:hypothetical protein [Maribacter sp.]
MGIDFIGLLVNFGLVVLIWMIQLIIYPSFLHYQTEDLVGWHRKYTTLIGYIVVPLMLAQLSISIFQVYASATFTTLSILTLVLLVWLSTFLQFVPIHSNISKGSVNQKMLSALVKKNWTRTILWTVVFIISFLCHYKV